MGRTLRRVISAALCTLFVLSLSATAADAGGITDQQRAERAIGFIARNQRANGSIPAFSPIGSTADAVLAIRAAGVGSDIETDALAYLRDQVRSGNVNTIGLKAKVVLAVVAAGRNPANFGGKNLVLQIRRTRDDQGRFGNGSASVFDQALVVLALAGSGGVVPNASVDWLRGARCPDGGWAFDEPYDPAADNRHCNDGTANDFFLSDTNTTSYALQAFEAVPAPGVNNPVAFFERIRDDALGGWGYSWGIQSTDANSTALVLQAYRALSRAIPPGARDALRGLQHARCGAFGFTYVGGTRTDPDVGATIGAVPGVLLQPVPIFQGPPLDPAPSTPGCAA